jgi:hypothetical protein
VSGKGKLIIIAFIVVVLLSAFGLLRLFTLRFEKGDVFPPYSSLRSDPLGCKALFMTLERSTGLDGRRNFRDLDRLKGLQGGTIYYLGAGEELLDASSDEQVRKLEALAGEGNRLVIAFGMVKGRPSATREREDKADGEAARDKRKKAADMAKSRASRGGVWGLEIGTFGPPAGPVKSRPRAALSATAAELPPTIPLHSLHNFKGDGKGWRPIYNYGERAVVLERAVGKGSIVLLAESYLLSNEALRNDRCPGLLAWLQGAGHSALFDESHLGVYDNPGVMELIKKHRLVPFVLALMALAALYVWKSAVPFVAMAAPETEQREFGVRDNFSGLVNLLRRNIAQGELLNTCFREWSRSFSREFRNNPALGEQVRAIVSDEAARPVGKRDPLARYREIARILEKKRLV